MIKVAIIDSNAQDREITKSALCHNNTKGIVPPIQILFDTGESLFSVDQEKSSPDVLILDIENQDSRVIEKVKKTFPEAEVIILTNLADLNVVRNCFRSGAVSYLLKLTRVHYLLFALVVTVNSGSFISPSISRALIRQATISKQYEDLLTARELHVANGIIEGLSYKMIADKYNISLDTVRVYVKRVYRKMNINSKGELIARLTLKI